MTDHQMPGTTVGTVGGLGATMFAQAQLSAGQTPWWVPLMCGLLTACPAIIAFVDRRLTARDARRAILAAQAAPPVKSDVTVTLVSDATKAS